MRLELSPVVAEYAIADLQVLFRLKNCRAQLLASLRTRSICLLVREDAQEHEQYLIHNFLSIVSDFVLILTSKCSCSKTLLMSNYSALFIQLNLLRSSHCGGLLRPVILAGFLYFGRSPSDSSEGCSIYHKNKFNFLFVIGQFDFLMREGQPYSDVVKS
jgi:hypothetical protein